MLTKLPAELRLQILDHLIPRDDSGGKTIEFQMSERQVGGPVHFATTTMYPCQAKSSLASMRQFLYGIGHVNRQLYEDAMTLVYE